ncbi:MAG: D-glycero-beta-D-manno-heptose-7-phosphate kinase [Flavobacteriales bacterium]|nr:D-glycero-beta-D-manno-heptose-7-phosphate kinase [Flavobacteriales bacterium]
MSTPARTLFDGFRKTRALVVGDVMVDAYLWGRVDRISPEAPVPVVQVSDRSERLGGAANVALNLHALGATPIVASVIGQDAAAERIATLFGQAELSTEGLMRSSHRKTTIKTRVIAGHQHIVRVDDEQDNELTATDEDALVHLVTMLIERHRPGVLVFEDYDKGVLTIGGIARITAAAKAAGVPVAVDPKKRNFFAYSGVDLFKPNLKELREGLKVDVAAGDREAVRQAVARLEQRLGNATSLITLSEHGVYAHRGGEEVALPAHKREIADVSGAGDTVIAVASLCLAAGTDLHTLAAWANLAGGLVCEHVGVVPVDREQLLRECELLATAKA